jgi:hypothetical protein
VPCTDLAGQRKFVRENQVVGRDELPCIPPGCIYRATALRREPADRVVGMPLFWNLRRA